MLLHHVLHEMLLYSNDLVLGSPPPAHSTPPPLGAYKHPPGSSLSLWAHPMDTPHSWEAFWSKEGGDQLSMSQCWSL